MWFPEATIDVEGGMPEAKRVLGEFLSCTVALRDAIKAGTAVAEGLEVPDAILDLQERCDDIFCTLESMNDDGIFNIGAEFCDDIPGLLADMQEESQHPGEGLLMVADELVDYIMQFA